MLHSKRKHILIKYLFFREQVAKKTIKMEYVTTKEHTTDIFTKTLARESFEYIRDKLGIVSADDTLLYDQRKKTKMH